MEFSEFEKTCKNLLRSQQELENILQYYERIF